MYYPIKILHASFLPIRAVAYKQLPRLTQFFNHCFCYRLLREFVNNSKGRNSTPRLVFLPERDETAKRDF